MKRILLAITLTAVILLSLAGCAQPDKNLPQHRNTEVKVILDYVPNTNHAGLYVARDMGYYAKQGLAVEIIQPSQTGAAQLVAAGQGDFGVSYQEEVTTARSEGIPLVALAAVIQHNSSGFASPAAKNIMTPKDFEGKTYGGWGSPMETAVLKALMAKYNGDFSKVNVINIGEADFFTSVQKDVDFAWIFRGWAGIEAELKGIKINYVDLSQEDPIFDYYTPVIICSEKQIAQNPDLVKKFLTATSQGYQYSIAHPAETADLFVKAVPGSDPELIKASMKFLAPRYQDDAARWGEMDLNVWKRYADFMYNNQLMKKNIDPAKAFTNEYLPK
ncbi:MAG: ABC transporter substrate-binding protein [Syntrophomonadaceae bacterium]|nr:ABC transporter substrate-binding protein [Syntrophomonadaceae bacterium]